MNRPQGTSQLMADDMGRAADSQTELDMKELCGKFSMETIATCAFGVSAETFSNDDSQFVHSAKAIFRRATFNPLLGFNFASS